MIFDAPNNVVHTHKTMNKTTWGHST